MKTLSSFLPAIQKFRSKFENLVLFAQPEPGKRNTALDVMKGLLILRMVFSHFYTGLGFDATWLTSTEWIFQVVIFSGLIFSFGFGTYKAYLEKETFPRRHIIINIIKILLAYVICGITYEIFKMQRISLEYILSIFTLETSIYLAEFLLTYALLLFLVLIIPTAFKWVTSTWKYFYPAIVLFLLTTFIPTPARDSNLLGLLIGNGSRVCFPVLQYLPLFLFGNYLAQKRNIFSLPLMLGSLVSLILLFIAQQNGLLTRYPPSFFWILGSMGIVYIVFLFSHLIARVGFLRKLLADVGSRTLYWYLLATVIVYTTSDRIGNFILPRYWEIILMAGLFFFIAFVSILTRKNAPVKE
jgi:hypothetical protein